MKDRVEISGYIVVLFVMLVLVSPEWRPDGETAQGRPGAGGMGGVSAGLATGCGRLRTTPLRAPGPAWTEARAGAGAEGDG